MQQSRPRPNWKKPRVLHVFNQSYWSQRSIRSCPRFPSLINTGNCVLGGGVTHGIRLWVWIPDVTSTCSQVAVKGKKMKCINLREEIILVLKTQVDKVALPAVTHVDAKEKERMWAVSKIQITSSFTLTKPPLFYPGALRQSREPRAPGEAAGSAGLVWLLWHTAAFT